MILQDVKLNSIEEFLGLIKEWYYDNYMDFRELYLNAVKHVHPEPDGVPNPWENADLNYLVDFFEGWYKWTPDLDSGLKKIQEFSWLYYENPEGLKFIAPFNDQGEPNPGYLMTKYFVELKGEWMDSDKSLDLVVKWMDELKKLGKMREYVVPNPELENGGFKSFNEFFSREIKPGVRPISSPLDDSVVVSPADAIVNMIDDDLSLTNKLNVKTNKLNVIELLNNSEYARVFEGGTAISNILMPTVYHRYHAPVSGTVVEANEDVPGIYFGIDDFPKLINGGNVGYGYDYSVFEDFRRGYLIIETESYGYVAMIPVGLNTIASVKFEDKFKKVSGTQRVPIYKGESVGYFQYGGSLNILLFQKGVFPAVRIPQGQIIGTMNKLEKKRVQFGF